MKKLLSACIAAAMLMGGAAAYEVPNAGMYDARTVYLCSDRINNDPAVQADLLHALGLFRGTEKGFELEKAMTRAEAAAMLTRFLGAEDKALQSAPAHPFTDVPEWAAPYVGWLCQNGLTKGVSATAYGADEPVTIAQFATFLSRAAAGNDAYGENGVLDEMEASNAEYPEPCTRAMAVALSTRVLTLPHTIDGDNRTMAQLLCEQGVFTAERFVKTAWDVLPPDFATEPNGDLTMTIAGIESARNTDGLTLDPASAARRDQGPLYAYAQKNGTTRVYAVEPRTLRAEELGIRRHEGATRFLGVYSGREYLFEEGGALLCRDEKMLDEVLTAQTLTRGGFVPETRVSTDYDGIRALTVSAPEGIYAIRESDGTPMLLDMGADTGILSYCGNSWLPPYLVTGPREGHAGLLRCFNLKTGEMQATLPTAADAVWHEMGEFLYGSRGLCEVDSEAVWLNETQTEYETRFTLTQWTAQPVYGVQTARWGGGMRSDPFVLTGANEPERLLLLRREGTVEEHITFARYGLSEVTMAGEFDGYDGAPHIFARNGKDPGVYAYVAADSWLSVNSYTPDTGTADEDAMCAAEQARLDALSARN